LDDYRVGALLFLWAQKQHAEYRKASVRGIARWREGFPTDY
jgi:hypothetical protein